MENKKVIKGYKNTAFESKYQALQLEIMKLDITERKAMFKRAAERHVMEMKIIASDLKVKTSSYKPSNKKLFEAKPSVNAFL